MDTKNKYNRRYDEEFKRDAIELLERGTRSAKQLGKELGISTSSLFSWKQKYGGTVAGIPSLTSASVKSEAQDLTAENKRLKKELETVSRQRDILKKACSIL